MGSIETNRTAPTDVVLQSGDVRTDIAIHYSKVATDAEISAMAAEYEGLTINGLEDVEGYDKAKKAKNTMARLRGAVEATRKGLKADVLVRGRTIDGEAKRIFALIEPIEAPLTAELDKIKAEQERIAQAKKDHALKVFNGRMEQLAEIGAVVAPTVVAQMDDEEWDERWAQECADHEKREAIRKEAEAAEAKRKAEAEAEAERVRAEQVELEARLQRERQEFREKVRRQTEEAEAEARRVHLAGVEAQKKIDAERAAFEAEKRAAEEKAMADANRQHLENCKAQAEINAKNAELDRRLQEEKERLAAEAAADLEDAGIPIRGIDMASISLMPTGEHPPETAIKGEPNRIAIGQLRLDALAKLAHDVRTFEITGHAQFARTEIQAVLTKAAAEIEALTSLIKEN